MEQQISIMFTSSPNILSDKNTREAIRLARKTRHNSAQVAVSNHGDVCCYPQNLESIV